MEPGNHAGGASEQIATDSSLAVAPVPPVAPQAEHYEPMEWYKTMVHPDEDSVCTLEPRREVAAAAEEAALEERHRFRQMADAMYSPEWLASVRRMTAERAHRAAAEAANQSTEPFASGSLLVVRL